MEHVDRHSEVFHESHGQSLQNDEVHHRGVVRQDVPAVALVLQVDHHALGNLPMQNAVAVERQQPLRAVALVQQTREMYRLRGFATLGEDDDQIAVTHTPRSPWTAELVCTKAAAKPTEFSEPTIFSQIGTFLPRPEKTSLLPRVSVAIASSSRASNSRGSME